MLENAKLKNGVPDPVQISVPELRFILCTTAVALAVSGLSSFFSWGWKAAAILAYGLFILLITYAFLKRSAFLKKIILFGVVAGFIELFADWWLVSGTNTLVYFSEEPFIWKSPAYMPFAWAVIITQAGYIGYLIRKKFELIPTVILTALAGAIMIPFHEYFANKALWWYYKDCKALFNTPYYIILGEAFICSVLPIIYKWIAQKKMVPFALTGIIYGFWIWISYFVAYHIFE